MDNKELLSKLDSLRDIYLPEEPSIFNLAIGWWILIVIVLVCITLLIRFLLKKNKKLKYQEIIITGYQDVINEFNSHNNKHKLAAETSEYLRRIVKYGLSDSYSARLDANEWVDFLEAKRENSNFKSQEFTSFKQILTVGCYDPSINYDTKEFISYTKQLIQEIVAHINIPKGVTNV